jgi:hypothetical protein
MWKYGIGALGAVVVFGVGTSAGAPCSNHVGKAKAECVEAMNEQAQRDRAEWPKYPVTTRDLVRRGIAWRRFVALGRCEQPGSGYGGVRWNTSSSWTWQGGTGMYRATHQSVGHPYNRNIGATNWQTQVLVAERVRLRYGITSWGAHKCWT